MKPTKDDIKKDLYLKIVHLLKDPDISISIHDLNDPDFSNMDERREYIEKLSREIFYEIRQPIRDLLGLK